MTRTALAVAAALALLLALRSPSARQRAISMTLGTLLAIDVTRAFLASWPALYVAGFVAWYAVTAIGVSLVLAQGGAFVALPFVPLVALSGEAYRRAMTAPLARASFALALAAQLVALTRFLGRGEKPDGAQRVALILVASSVADLAGPWLVGNPARDWYAGKWPALLTWAAIAGWEARCLMRVRSPRE